MRKIFAFLVVLTALALCDCANNARGREQAATNDPAPTAPVAYATRADLSSTLALTAEFEPYQEVDVMAKVSGYLKTITVDVGDRVHEGQVLATLEVPEMQDDLARDAAAIDQAEAEIASATSELQRAQSAHDMAHLSYTRIQDVSNREPGLVPRQEVDEIHSRDLVAEAQVSAARSNVTAAQQKARVARADLARVTTMTHYLTITAPFEGVVTKRYANIGSLIQAGTSSQTQAMPVIQLSQNNLLRLILPVPESAVEGVHVGEPVDVNVTSLNRTFPGRVTRFTGLVQTSTRTMNTEVDVPNPSLTLVPGMYADVQLQLQNRKDVLTAPLDAIDESGAKQRVFKVSREGVVHVVAVTLGLESATKVEVLSGLKDGDAVIVGRRGGLKEGDRVRPKAAETSTNP